MNMYCFRSQLAFGWLRAQAMIASVNKRTT
jgi:hypothetical protein